MASKEILRAMLWLAIIRIRITNISAYSDNRLALSEFNFRVYGGTKRALGNHLHI